MNVGLPEGARYAEYREAYAKAMSDHRYVREFDSYPYATPTVPTFDVDGSMYTPFRLFGAHLWGLGVICLRFIWYTLTWLFLGLLLVVLVRPIVLLSYARIHPPLQRSASMLQRRGSDAADRVYQHASDMQRKGCRFADGVRQMYITLRYNSVVDRARLYRQRVAHGFDRWFLTGVAIVLIGLCVDDMVMRQIRTAPKVQQVTLMEANHLGFKVPAWVLESEWRRSMNMPSFQPAKYAREAVEPKVVTSVVTSLATSVQTQTVVVTESWMPAMTGDSKVTVEEAGTKGRRVSVGTSMVWCNDCRQSHCCEVPV